MFHHHCKTLSFHLFNESPSPSKNSKGRFSLSLTKIRWKFQSSIHASCFQNALWRHGYVFLIRREYVPQESKKGDVEVKIGSLGWKKCLILYHLQHAIVSNSTSSETVSVMKSGHRLVILIPKNFRLFL